jgi:lipopolysaccharide transport system ATP-binding protein
MTIVIEALGLGKEYARGAAQRSTPNSLRDALSDWARGLGKRAKPERSSGRSDRFWALKDVSFSIKQGEVVGIIGRNGSGKSTLLKIVSQITAPTKGEVRINGRTGTLLEVGTGFHPELTGRENIFLNGTILGMGRHEIRRKFDEIVEFSGVESFIDTPVKRYSSGMQMRLAFAVAAHLDPDILVVDEVLAVGDAEFQKKCLGKMDGLSKSGRTVLFVSHNMSAVDQLCGRVIWLDGGKVIVDSADVYSATSRYLFGEKEGSIKGEWRPPLDQQFETEYFSLRWLRVRDESGRTIDGAIRNDQQAYIEIALTVKKLHPGLELGYAVFNEGGIYVYMSLMSDGVDVEWPKIALGDVVLSSPLPRRFLNEGLFRLDLMAGLRGDRWFSVHRGTPFAVFLRIKGGLSGSSRWTDARSGVVAPVLPWATTSAMDSVLPSGSQPEGRATFT